MSLTTETERSLRDLIYSNLPNGHKGRTRLGRRCVCYDDNGTHVVAKLHKLRKDQLFSLYERLRNMGLLKALPPISEVTA